MKKNAKQKVFYKKKGEGHLSLVDPQDIQGLEDEIEAKVQEEERQRFIHDDTDSETDDNGNNYKIKSHHGRVGYEIVGDYLTAYRTKDGEKLGQLEMGDGGNLGHIEVYHDFQRRGIGSKLIEIAIEHCELAHISYAMETEGANYCLSPDGEALIAACLRKKVVTPDMCYLPVDAQYPSFNVSSALSDRVGTKKTKTFSDYGMSGDSYGDGDEMGDDYQSDFPSPM